VGGSRFRRSTSTARTPAGDAHADGPTPFPVESLSERKLDPAHQLRVALGEQRRGSDVRDVRQRDHRMRGDAVASDELRYEGGVAAALGDAAPEVVVLPAVKAAIGRVAAEGDDGASADERHRVDVVAAPQALGLPRE